MFIMRRSEFTFENISKVVKVYRRVEKMVDCFMPASRRGNRNNMCRSIVGANDQYFTMRNSAFRYFKLNVQSFFRHGTVEFRHHSGTLDAVKIKNWVLFTAIVTEKARGTVSSQKELKRWVDVKWYLGMTTERCSDQVKEMVKFYTRRLRSMGVARSAA